MKMKREWSVQPRKQEIAIDWYDMARMFQDEMRKGKLSVRVEAKKAHRMKKKAS